MNKKLILILSFYSLLMAESIENIKSHPRIFITSIPKSGTHLLMRCIQLLTGKKPVVRIEPKKEDFTNLQKDEFLMTHSLPTIEIIKVIEEQNFKGIFIYRDPRDQLMSLIFWIDKFRQKWPQLDGLFINDLIFKFINGTEQPFIWYQWYKDYLPWLDNKNVYSTCFEKLVGSRGGGKDADLDQEIKNIAKHVQFNISDENIEKLIDQLYGRTGTFREGQIGSWKKHFKNDHIREFKKVAGQLLIDLNYENDLSW